MFVGRWQDAGGRREAFYTNLGPGSYQFQVIAANDDGVWNRTGAALAFTIPPSFTQTRWFLAVWLAALGGLIWLAYLIRMRQVASGLRVRYQAALAERSRIAQDLHDTLLQDSPASRCSCGQSSACSRSDRKRARRR